jgi:hypothetical protein
MGSLLGNAFLPIVMYGKPLKIQKNAFSLKDAYMDVGSRAMQELLPRMLE